MNAATLIVPTAFVGALLFAGIAFRLQAIVLDQLRKNVPAQLRDEVMLRTVVRGHVWLPGISKDVRRKYVWLNICGCAFFLCVATIVTVAAGGWPAPIFWGLSLVAIAMTAAAAIRHRDQLR